MSRIEFGVGAIIGDIQTLHYTRDGQYSLCGSLMDAIFRWSQYPGSGHGCDLCADRKRLLV